jgi:hypothetical protein
MIFSLTPEGADQTGVFQGLSQGRAEVRQNCNCVGQAGSVAFLVTRPIWMARRRLVPQRYRLS